MVIIIFFIVHWYLSLFSQTFFLHRYAAHRMFTMSKFWERFFYIFTFITQGSSYLSPYAYGILHRLHHAHADTKDDPHSPRHDHNLFSMMWRTKNVYSDILANRMDIDEKYKKDLPQWHAVDSLADRWWVRIMWGTVYFAVYWFFADMWWLWIFYPMQIVMGPLHGAIINWFAHKYGYINFKTEDTAKNLLPIDFLMMGESYHNNHHKFGSRPNFGYRWFEIDPVYPIILGLNALGIIRLRRRKAQLA
ncbi:MAG: acyl-CoA desaturase [Microscillaceae bacterium]|nr:acyl-CoA desaturase [Microscillaceae bacterium]